MHAYNLPPGQPTPGWLNLLRPLIALLKYWNINQFPIGYASRPRLRGRLTQPRLTLDWNPWSFSEQGFHPFCRYSRQHSHFWYLQHTSQSHLHRLTERSPTTWLNVKSAASAHSFSPVTSSAQPTRLVSYYAFFKGWLLLSQPPSCLCLPHRFPLNYDFGALAGGLDCFPLDYGR